MNESPDSFFSDMAEDFFAECDELLSLIRKSLLKIDELEGRDPGKQVIEDLLRSCHTLKGLTGMIGALDIMHLTHALEEYLKAVYEGSLTISSEALDTVFSCVSMLELQLSALRNKTGMPDSAVVFRQVTELLPRSELDKVREKSVSGMIRNGAHQADQENKAGEEGELTLKFSFTPSKELFEKGININSVRSRIQESGNIISSFPRIIDGQISFEFIASTNRPPSFFDQWKTDGITYEIRKKSEDGEKPGEGKNPASSETGISDTANRKNIVRVDLKRLDNIMQTVGDLFINRSRLSDHISKMSVQNRKEDPELEEINSMMEKHLKNLREEIMKLRLVPVAQAFERMKFVVRDLIRESSKSIDLELKGQDTQIDKFVLERMYDPLLHLVRNAVSHGIETTEERRASGKPPSGRLSLKASASGDSVIFEIIDDGRGIDREAIREKAVSMGIIESDARFDDTALINLISSAGFSTMEQTDMVSGRGIGMNVVKAAITELGGTLDFSSEKGKGTKFIVQLPLTLSIVDALIVTAGSSVFAVPLPVVNEVARFRASDLVKMENNEMISHRDFVLPVVKLTDFFNLRNDNLPSFDALIVGQGTERVGITVDRIMGQREIVVRSLSDPLIKVDGISGATELGEGKIILILDTPAVIRSAIREKKHKKVTENQHQGK